MFKKASKLIGSGSHSRLH